VVLAGGELQPKAAAGCRALRRDSTPAPLNLHCAKSGRTAARAVISRRRAALLSVPVAAIARQFVFY